MNDTHEGPTAWVLAGGGSLGAIQVGMLRSLVEHGLRPDLLVGASVGAINAAYFAGHPDRDGVERLERIWRGLTRHEVFPIAWRRLLWPHGSNGGYLVNPDGLRGLLEQHLPYASLEQASLPVHVVATDQIDGSAVTLSRGPAIDAVLASAAIPALFPPVAIGGRALIDGAVADNTPIGIAVELGARHVIVLPTGFACALDAPPRGAVASALHAITLLIARQLNVEFERYRNQAVITMVPPLCPLAASPYDFTQSGTLMVNAAEQTRHWLAHDRHRHEFLARALFAHRH